MRGSLWRRWDLHIHSPGTKLANQYNSIDWDEFLKKLEESEVQVFGITDYFSYENYFTTIEKYKEKYPEGEKKFFLNIEFRLNETVSSDATNVHTHVLFDNNASICNEGNLNKLLSRLETLEKTESGASITCNELESERDFKKATVGIRDLVDKLKEVFGNEEPYLIITAANNDGLRGVDSTSARSISISDALDEVSHAFWGGAQNTQWFLRNDRYDTEKKSLPKPVYSGSDAHSLDDLERLSGDVPKYPSTWIKADLTFRGLRQTLFEPKGRVFIGERPDTLIQQSRESTRFVDSLIINQVSSYNGSNGKWFKDVKLLLNPELTAIIGNKGSGKSAIADIIALLGNSHQSEHFSFLTDDIKNRKFRQKGFAENFNGELYWLNGIKAEQKLDHQIETFKREAVKYLPQNYFESLTNEIEVKAFREEIEDVVFSHVDRVDRMEKSNFRELEEFKTAQSKSDISDLKIKLRDINREISEAEGKLEPNYVIALNDELVSKKAEYTALEKSKPQEISKPDEETAGQKKVSLDIERLTNMLVEITDKKDKALEKVTNLKTRLQSLCALKDSILSIESRLVSDIDNLTMLCEGLELDIKQILSYNIDISYIDSNISETTSNISILEIAIERLSTEEVVLDEINSIPDLKNAQTAVENRIKELKETLSAPHKRYQNYRQTFNEIVGKQKALKGDELSLKPGTISFVQGQIDHIQNDLMPILNKLHDDRKEISRSIYVCKKKVKELYDSLKESVEEQLSKVSSEDFSVTIDASFIISHTFENDFLNHINQTVKGSFKGKSDGSEKINSLVAEVDWDEIESILKFLDNVINEIKSNPVSSQIQDIKKFYDFLFSFEFFDSKYELRLDAKNLNQLSPGEKGLLLLVFYLHLDKETTPLIIDQPEDNLDNDSIFSVLANCIREAKKRRQVILVTHNPNLAVGADAEQIIYVSLAKHKNYEFSYQTGAIEQPKINDAIVKILEGSRPAFVQRRLKYQIK